MLLGNGTYLNANAGRLFGGGGAMPISQGNYQKVGAWRGVALPDGGTADLPLIGYPTGYFGEGWFMPITGGGMTSRYNTDFSFTPTGGMLLGRALATSIGDPTVIGMSFPLTTDAELVSTVAAGGAPTTFDISTNVPLLTASISGDNVGQPCNLGIDTNVPTLGAIASLTNLPTIFGMDGTLTSHAIGIMEGTTADSGVTIDNIVTALETAVLPVNIVKVNDYTVDGAGTSGNPWGPA